jgi:hypothetical protein
MPGGGGVTPQAVSSCDAAWVLQVDRVRLVPWGWDGKEVKSTADLVTGKHYLVLVRADPDF